MNKNPSLLEGLDIPDKHKGGGSSRRDLFSAAASSASKAVSHDWTPKQKKIAAIGLAGMACAALVYGGVLFVRNRPLQLPKTFEEGKAAMATARFQNMDELRQAQYKTEMDRLFREKMGTMKEEGERRDFFRDESNREVMQQIREQMFDDMAKRVAKGETPQFPFGPGGPGGPGGFRGPREPSKDINLASLDTFKPRAGDEPPSPAPRPDRRDFGPGGPNGGPNGGQNNNGRNGGPNGQPNGNQPGAPGNNQGQPGNGNQPAPGSGSPGAGSPGSGAPGAGGGGGGGGGRMRGNPTARIANRIQNGNAQSNGLRYEMMKKMEALRAANGRQDQNPGVRVMFVSGTSEITTDGFASLGTIAKQLNDQPETAVRIWGLIDMDTDGKKVRHEALRDSFAVKLFGTGAKGTRLTKSQLEDQMVVAYNEMLAKKAAEAGKPAPALVGPNSEVAAPAVAAMENELVETIQAPADLLIILAQERQDAIKKYLVEKKEFNPVRVRIVGVSTQFMETNAPSAVLQVAK
ncbi:MAG: hypothetical protein KF691_07540 [Phycisphaeraceae bacterium]|nr:hypothetical protein [Phycisphaeraceae bacterium]